MKLTLEEAWNARRAAYAASEEHSKLARLPRRFGHLEGQTFGEAFVAAMQRADADIRWAAEIYAAFGDISVTWNQNGPGYANFDCVLKNDKGLYELYKWNQDD